MQLVVLAAGHGRRFGGLKQLAPVGPDDQAIMDYTAEDALAAGCAGVVLVVREEVREELLSHIARHWPAELGVEAVVQGPIAGTAQAVASTKDVIDGPFGVANADDLYGRAAIAALLSRGPELTSDNHAIVGYRLADSIINRAPVTRGVCEVSDDGYLVRIVEQTVTPEVDGSGFSGTAVGAPASSAPQRLEGGEVVSMNLWGFSRTIFDGLESAIRDFDPATAPHSPGKPPELLLPSVVGSLVEAGLARVRVSRANGRCIGLTHPEDLSLVREIVAKERYEPKPS